ncbi:Ankyrin Repeat Domain-Containing Protein 23 [Manis pentadactyla]|nr:Ankyrin Repeat Domain-Containing Protein 23 [Manis pentadactyla]
MRGRRGRITGYTTSCQQTAGVGVAQGLCNQCNTLKDPQESSESPEMRPTSTMTQCGFHPSPNWMESSHEAILHGSNLSLELLGEFGEETCLRAVFQGPWRYSSACA